jgi:hypothetical protein
MIEQMVEEGLYIPTVMFMKDNGRMIKPMVKEFILRMMDLAMLESGYKIYNMDLEFKNGLMVHHMKGKNKLNLDSIYKDVNMVTGSLLGQMDQFMKENFRKISCKAMEKCLGLMENLMKGSGKKIK